MSSDRVRVLKKAAASLLAALAAFGLLSPDDAGQVETVVGALLVVASVVFAADKIEAK